MLTDRKTLETEQVKSGKLGETLVKAKIIDKPEELELGVKKLLADRKDAEEQLADLTTMVKTAQTEAKKQKDLLTTAETKLVAADKMMQTIKQELVDAKYLEPNAGDEKIVQGVKDVVKIVTTDSSKERWESCWLNCAWPRMR